MQLASPERAHLTYCSKVHPGHGWAQVWPQLQACVPRLKARLSPQAPFGLGLRLSASECEELLSGDRLLAFKDFLAAHDLYVFTLNGFPYGAFHGPRVKAEVFAPDWREQAPSGGCRARETFEQPRSQAPRKWREARRQNEG